jgi:hypothetical protein
MFLMVKHLTLYNFPRSSKIFIDYLFKIDFDETENKERARKK